MNAQEDGGIPGFTKDPEIQWRAYIHSKIRELDKAVESNQVGPLRTRIVKMEVLVALLCAAQGVILYRLLESWASK